MHHRAGIVFPSMLQVLKFKCYPWRVPVTFEWVEFLSFDVATKSTKTYPPTKYSRENTVFMCVGEERYDFTTHAGSPIYNHQIY